MKTWPQTRRLALLVFCCLATTGVWNQSALSLPAASPPPSERPAGYTLVWADEFNQNGRPDPRNWIYDPEWSSRFHVWRMDWDRDFIRLFVDDQLLNTIDLAQTRNNDRERANPFREPHYLILNLAIGGTNGGDPSDTRFPARFEVD
jgi:hypothetical protein